MGIVDVKKMVYKTVSPQLDTETTTVCAGLLANNLNRYFRIL